jgi:lipopolysaccharide/colanic/teichoic acid biosynthesis glycosyltransferase
VIEIDAPQGFRQPRFDVFRAVDIIGAWSLLILCSPVFVTLALLVLVTQRRPILYRQSRIGRNGVTFHLLKFRTMPVGSDRLGLVSVRDDPRVGRVGRWMRNTKLDEFPQLLNIIRGSMALVGPRPMVRPDFERLDARQRGRVLVRPGLTGLAQVSGNTALPWPRRIELDLHYVATRSIRLDLAILLRTAGLVLSGRAATDPPGPDEWADPLAGPTITEPLRAQSAGPMPRVGRSR